METAPLNESERAEYCRRRGLYPQQITAWRRACESATDWAGERGRQRAAVDREVRSLQREPQRKEKALAETAALLTLSKKARTNCKKNAFNDVKFLYSVSLSYRAKKFILKYAYRKLLADHSTSVYRKKIDGGR